MQEQTAVIQIDTSHSSNLIITEKTLGMNKTRCILINFYTTFEQRFIMGLRQKENHFLIRDSRCHNPHIHTTLCSVAQLTSISLSMIRYGVKIYTYRSAWLIMFR